MMDAELRAQLEDGLVRFTREKYAREAWQTYGREPDGYDSRVWTQMSELGWFALGLPESVGGTGDSVCDLVPLFIAAGAGLWREPLLQVLGDACGALLALDRCEACDHLLSGVASGERRIVLACAETKPSLSAEQRTGDLRGYVVQGQARFAAGAASCSELIVRARSGPSDATASLFAVARGAPGVRVTSYPAVDHRMPAVVDFNYAPAYRIGSAASFTGPCARSVILAAAEAVGAMRAVIAATCAHLASRKQFGQPLAQFQVLRHRLAALHILSSESHAHVWAAAEAHDRRADDIHLRLLRLRVQCARAARRVVQEGIQLHGAMGMTRELPIGDWYKRVLALENGYLRPDAALDELAR
jgi:alkylation response protein AidB-like acyl-CoA dehydrogenase